jgi:Transposon-encoded protein TnpV
MDPTAQEFEEEHRQFLQENAPHVLEGLRRSGTLDSYLASIGETASERLEHVMSQHLADKELQKLPHLERVRELQNRHQEAEEIIRHDLILQPVEN